MIKWIFILITLSLCSQIQINAQDYVFDDEKKCLVDANGDCMPNEIFSAVSFLSIIPDARSSALGFSGVAISPDPNAMYFNASKLAFADKHLGIVANSYHWKIFDYNFFLLNFAGYYKLNDKHALGLRFEQLIYPKSTIKQLESKEFVIEGAFSKKLSKNLSVGISSKYIYSKLSEGKINGIDIYPAQAFAVDFSLYHRSKLEILDREALLSFGLAIKNIGSKITYTNSINKDYIPANFAIGSALKIDINDVSNLTLTLDINKQLLPTPDTTGAIFQGSSIHAAIVSWYDAPGGIKEELREYFIGGGLEYWLYNTISLRTGYYYVNPLKGDFQVFTFGIGVKYKFINVNSSYGFDKHRESDYTSNQFRFSLLFEL